MVFGWSENTRQILPLAGEVGDYQALARGSILANPVPKPVQAAAEGTLDRAKGGIKLDGDLAEGEPLEVGPLDDGPLEIGEFLDPFPQPGEGFRLLETLLAC